MFIDWLPQILTATVAAAGVTSTAWTATKAIKGQVRVSRENLSFQREQNWLNNLRTLYSDFLAAEQNAASLATLAFAEDPSLDFHEYVAARAKLNSLGYEVLLFSSETVGQCVEDLILEVQRISQAEESDFEKVIAAVNDRRIQLVGEMRKEFAAFRELGFGQRANHDLPG